MSEGVAPALMIMGSTPRPVSVASRPRSKIYEMGDDKGKHGLPSLFSPVHDGELRKVTVHVTFMKLGEINTLKEQYDAEVLVRSCWREPLLDSYNIETQGPVDWKKFWNPRVFIENALGDPKMTSSIALEIRDGREAWVLERKLYRGTYMETLELWEFPFDVQDLSVTVMSDLPSNEVDVIEDPDEIHKIFKQSFIDEQEWYLYKCIHSLTKQVAKDRADPTVRRSALMVCCRAARRPAYFIWNIFSVTMVLALFSFVTFAVDPSKVENRLQLTYTLVLTTVAFKFVVNQSLPRISYLTYLDRYVMATMVVLAGICFWHGAQKLIPDKHQDNDYIALLVFIAAYIVYNIQFFVRIAMVPYRKRREMAKAEKEYIATVKRQTGSYRV